jgi:hypothetical protein
MFLSLFHWAVARNLGLTDDLTTAGAGTARRGTATKTTNVGSSTPNSRRRLMVARASTTACRPEGCRASRCAELVFNIFELTDALSTIAPCFLLPPCRGSTRSSRLHSPLLLLQLIAPGSWSPLCLDFWSIPLTVYSVCVVLLLYDSVFPRFHWEQ